MLKKIFGGFIGVKGIIIICSVIVVLWFRYGLLFAGAEEELSFYNFSRTLELFSHTWYAVGTGMPTLLFVPRVPYFEIFNVLYKTGIQNYLLEAITFLLLILTGTLSIYFLVSETTKDILKPQWKKLVPFLAGLFYFFNPFALTQIWGRALSYQFFAFALVPSFLLFFVLSITRRNLFFCIPAALISFFLSTAYLSPAAVVSSWSAVGIYLIYHIYTHRQDKGAYLFGIFSFILLLSLWIIVNLFWIYPFLKHGNQLLNENLTQVNNIESLKGLSPNSRIYNVVRLIHREYYDGTYGAIYNSPVFVLITWLLPIFGLFAIAFFKKSKHFIFYTALLVISIFISIGANFPTGEILIWFFKHFPLLQVLRNPYEKFGVNLIVAYAPFAAIGMLALSEKLAVYFKKKRFKKSILPVFVVLEFVVLVWPYWNGSFAGGVRTNFWVKVPDYYSEANNWLNQQQGNFNILQLPLSPGDGVTYTWDNFYEGIEASEFMFDKPSIARNIGYNKNYYSALLERFGAAVDYQKLPNWSTDNTEFKDKSLKEELAKINVRYLILHYDTDYKFRNTKSPQETAKYLEGVEGIQKVAGFGKLDIYEVGSSNETDLIYSPNAKVRYRKLSPVSYVIDVENAKGSIDLYFLQGFHTSWEAYIGSEKITNHQEVFSYANGWKINKEGNFQVIIKYAQDETYNAGKMVAFTGVSLLLLVTAGYLLKMRKRSS